MLAPKTKKFKPSPSESHGVLLKVFAKEVSKTIQVTIGVILTADVSIPYHNDYKKDDAKLAQLTDLNVSPAANGDILVTAGTLITVSYFDAGFLDGFRIIQGDGIRLIGLNWAYKCDNPKKKPGVNYVGLYFNCNVITSFPMSFEEITKVPREKLAFDEARKHENVSDEEDLYPVCGKLVTEQEFKELRNGTMEWEGNTPSYGMISYNKDTLFESTKVKDIDVYTNAMRGKQADGVVKENQAYPVLVILRRNEVKDGFEYPASVCYFRNMQLAHFQMHWAQFGGTFDEIRGWFCGGVARVKSSECYLNDFSQWRECGVPQRGSLNVPFIYGVIVPDLRAMIVPRACEISIGAAVRIKGLSKLTATGFYPDGSIPLVAAPKKTLSGWPGFEYEDYLKPEVKLEHMDTRLLNMGNLKWCNLLYTQRSLEFGPNVRFYVLTKDPNARYTEIDAIVKHMPEAYEIFAMWD